MNRHFQSYAALPCEPLGAPIRKQTAKPSPETPWKPIPGHPDHVERINAQGAREVTHKDWVPAPPPPPAPAAPALDPGRVMPEDVHGSCLTDVPEGATHRDRNGTFYRANGGGAQYWCRGCWVESLCSADDLSAGVFTRLPQPAAPTEWQSGPPPSRGWYDSYCVAANFTVKPLFVASYWDGKCWTHNTGAGSSRSGVVPNGGWCKVWRGPRLTGEAWPEPQQ